MRHHLIRLIILATVAVLAVPAFAADEPKPAAPKPPPVVSPEIKADGSVVFRIKAAKAAEVQVRGQWAKDALPMVKDEQGVWSATSAPLPAGVWEYSLVVDGVTMVDPGNVAIKPMREPRTSILHLPGAPAKEWDFQDVPHGTLHTHVYASKAVGGPREVMVYTPPGYEAGSAVYPLLVLQHGSGDNQQTWTAHGKAHYILDNLIASGRALPMVVLMLNGHPPAGVVKDADPAKRRAEAMDAFVRELVQDALPLVDGTYRVAKGPEQRAIAGLSMGGGHALGAGLTHLDRFAWIGAFSAAPPEPDLVKPVLDDAAGTNARIKLLWIAIGKDDFLLPRDQTFIATLKEKGIQHEFLLTDGGHAWPVWRQYLIDFAPRLFKAK
jgi:enterochelin esterase family protein